MIVFLGCGAKKNDKKCKAIEMYTGELFKKRYEYSKILKADKIFILSAKYHVLELDDMIFPYNKTLNDMDEKSQKIWSLVCKKKLDKKNIDYDDDVYFLCGENYFKYLSPYFKNSHYPVANLRIGEQLKFYKERINKTSDSDH